MTELARKTVSGATLNLSVTAARNFVQFLIILPILARILPPEEFGLVGMAMTFVVLLTMVNDLGVSSALVRAENPSDKFWTSAFWTNAVLGVLFTTLAFLSAPAIAAFFREPQVEVLTQALSITLVMHCVFLVPMAWLQRNFRFATIATIDFLSTLVSAIVAISMAMAGYGVWALVFQQISIYVVKLGGVLLMQRAPVFAGFDFSEIMNVLRFSLQLSGANIINFLNRSSDGILIGRFLGAESLGYYGRANQIMLMPVQSLATGVSFALYPALSSIQKDQARLARLYLRTVSILACIIIPMMVGLSLVTEPFVATLFGPNWGPVADVLFFLCFVAIIQSMIATSDVLWTALGQSGVLLRWSVIRLFSFLAAFAVGIWVGTIEAVAAAYLVPNLLLFVPYQHSTLKRVGLDWNDLAEALGPALVSVAMMASALVVVEAALPGLETWPAPVQLVLLLPIGIATYCVSMLVLFRPYLNDLLKEGRDLFVNRGVESAA